MTKESHFISPTTKPMATKHCRMVTHLNQLLYIKSHDTLIMWSCGVTWQTNPLYLHYQSACGHQIWEDGDLPWGAHKVTWRFDHIVLQHHVTNQNHDIFIITVPMTTKHVRMMTYLEGLLTIKSQDAFITWACMITLQSKTIISPLPQCL